MQFKPKLRTIAIVGNGQSLLGSNLGAAIDVCDEVIRFSAFETYKYEIDVGTRTDTWCGYMAPHSQMSMFKRILFPLIGRVDMSAKMQIIKKACAFFNKPFLVLPEEINLIAHEALNLLLYDKSDKRKPTSGFCTIMYYMRHCPDAKIYIAGFDGYTSGHHYYAPSSTPKNVHNKHLPKKEMEIIETWIKEKKIYRLTNN